MLTVAQINNVSFGKAGFSGYKPIDVDNFIDEVAESFEQLEKERNEAQLQAQQLQEENASLAEKNAELAEKLSVLAQKIENYREDEEGIKEALLNAQRMGKRSVEDAKDKATIILQDAKDEAASMMDQAKMDASRAVQEYNEQIEAKREELEEMKRQVSAFRTSLMEMYRKHLECIDHIPVFKTKEKEQPEVTEPQPEEPVTEEAVEEVVQEEVQPEVEKKVTPAEVPSSAANAPVAHTPVAEQHRHSIQVETAAPQQERRKQDSKRTLNDRVDFTQDESGYDDLSDVGIDLKTYNNIPESLRQEKNSHYSHLEFGEDVDLGRKKRKK